MMPSLTFVGNLFATQAKAKANSVRAPGNIQDAFYLDSPNQQGTIFYIDVHIDLKIAPAAAAYEWGSGIHAKFGEAKEYPIPREPTGVSFPKERWPNYKPPPGKSIPDYFYFDQISHPGVAARPYLQPTLEEHIQEYSNLLGGGLIAQMFAESEKRVEIVVNL